MSLSLYHRIFYIIRYESTIYQNLHFSGPDYPVKVLQKGTEVVQPP